jgi:hypothetical protein
MEISPTKEWLTGSANAHVSSLPESSQSIRIGIIHVTHHSNFERIVVGVRLPWITIRVLRHRVIWLLRRAVICIAVIVGE